MSLVHEDRLSDSPFVDKITRGQTLSAGSTIRPSESHWHMVLVRVNGVVHPLVVGPLTTSGTVSWGKDAEILWIHFKLGVFMPRIPLRRLMNLEFRLPEATSKSFWLNGSAWQFPDFENADTFIDRLVRDEALAHDPLVNAALEDQAPDVAPRTVRHRFLQATGLTQTYIRQMYRAQAAERLLQQGVSILDTIAEAGYFDQPHLTRSLKRFVGHTPAEIIRASQLACHSIQDNLLLSDYNSNVPEKTLTQNILTEAHNVKK